jgi:hypothetical protein
MAETKTTKTKKSKLFPNEPLVTIKLPLTRTEKEDLWVAVNGKSMQIKRGVEVEVPLCIAKAIEHQERQTMSIVEQIDALTSKASDDELN